MLIDSHCHLNYEGLVENQAGVLDRARQAGVAAFLNISTRRSEWGDVVGTAEREPDVWASIGIRTKPTSTPIWARARCWRRPRIRA